jgi:iron complex outermembrane receptor protein
MKAAYDIEDHKILAGYWYERANHRQTQPGTTVGNDGGITDLWLKTGLITYNNGDPYEGRNYKTVSTGSSAFISDTYTQGKLDIIPGVRYTSIQRNFTNYASSGTGLGADYTAQATYSKALPSIGLRYRLDDATQIFGNITENMRAPSNFVLAGWVNGGTISNGVLTGYTLKPNTSIKAETATNTEIGMRFNQESYKASVAFFNVDFQNRIAQGYNPDTATYTDYNVGKSNVKGIEAEIGTKPVHGWSFYGSATYSISKILNDFPATSTTTLPTTGSIFPDTPRVMWAASAQYTSGPWLAMLTAKYTGKRYTTLVNDEYLDAYTVYDFNAGYKFESSAFFKNPTLRMSVSNLFNKSYLIANSGSGSNITTTTNTSAPGGGIPTYYVGAPRFTSFTFSTEF